MRQRPDDHPDRGHRDHLQRGLEGRERADPDGQRVAEGPGAADRGGLAVTGQGQPEQLAQRDQRPESQRVPGLHQAGRSSLRHGRDQQQASRGDQQQLA